VPRTVTVIGSANVDISVLLSRLPSPGETVSGGTLVRSLGGKGANQAVAAARAGADVRFIGCVGEDGDGDEIVDTLRREGVDTAHVRRSGSASGVALALVGRSGENLIGVAPGANASLSPDDVRNASDAIADSETLLLQLGPPPDVMRLAVGIAAEHDVPVILNPAPVREDRVRAIEPFCPALLVPNEIEARQLLRQTIASDEGAARRLGQIWNCPVLISLGARGALLLDENALPIPAPAVESVDTVGAGDCLLGYLAARWRPGESPVEAAKFACAAAALSTTRPGAMNSIPAASEVEDFLAGQGD